MNAVYKIEAMNTLAILVVTYSFNINKQTAQGMKNLDRKTRKLLAKERMHHPKPDTDGLCLPRSSGGRGLIQIEQTTYKTTTIDLATCLEKSKAKGTQQIFIVATGDFCFFQLPHTADFYRC